MGKINLKEMSTSSGFSRKRKEAIVQKTAALQKQLYDLLYLMFAHDRYSLLVILQGIDASGKDGTVRHLFSCANPQGIKVFSFKRPSVEEFRHDFLWRCHRHTPESGLAVIFNRSYYEEVTRAKVHPELLQEQHIPDDILRKPDFFKKRYESINAFEKHLTRKGTILIKFLLHISKKEQKTRIDARLKNLDRNWKFSLEDVKERKHWDEYQAVFQEMLSETSTKHSPWTVVPADEKWYRDYVVTLSVVNRLKRLKMNFPKKRVP